MMKKGFTLLELVVVIIILGVLATLGITQYGSMVEKARIAEAKAILGDMRKLAIAYRLQNGTVNGITNADVNIGPGADQIPAYASCRSTHYFCYRVEPSGSVDPVVALEAYRCPSGGKAPQGPCSNWDCWIQLFSNLVTGQDTWVGSNYAGTP